MAVRCTLGKGERLVRAQHIETLFRTGKAFSVFPLRIIYQLVPCGGADEFPIRAGFSAAKKKYKKAVDRNRAKRLMREAWRLQKSALSKTIPTGKQLQLFIICTSAELPQYKDIYVATDKAIRKLQEAIIQLVDA